MAIKYHSRFPADPFGDGGHKRSAQVRELIDSLGVDIAKMDFSLPTPSLLTKIKAIPRLSPRNFKGCHDIKSFKDKLHAIVSDFELMRKISSQISPNDLIIWESVISEYGFLPHLAKKTHIPIIALPHNLESLVPSQRSRQTGVESPIWFNEELEYLSSCNHIFTISREEQWLLGLYGIEAHYLPYYPVKEVCSFFEEIRRKRQGNEGKNKLLLLGTAGNPPTFLGMRNRIELLSKCEDRHIREIHIAGYGTERLSAFLPPKSNIVLHGSVSNSKLESLLVDAKMVIIHQPASSGALTKIPELLIAGIPIAANPFAAKNYFNTDGLYVYNSDDELIDLISLDLGIPDVPEKPIKYEKLFMERVNQFLS